MDDVINMFVAGEPGWRGAESTGNQSNRGRGEEADPIQLQGMITTITAITRLRI